MLLAERRNGLGKRAHESLLPLVVVAYALAAVCPTPGLRARQCLLAEAGGTTLTLPMALLAVLLFNAGFGLSGGQIGAVVRWPLAVLAGVAVNLLTPVAFLIALRLALVAWHDPVEADCLLLGLAVVAAMPVAVSSTAWAQHAGGNVALSLGLLLVSTFLSPLTTPLVLALVGRGIPGAAPGGGTGEFLLAVVVAPSALGLLLRQLAGDNVASRLKPTLKLANVVVLLMLCYGNATAALPHVVADPDWDYLALVVAAVFGLCVTAFTSGWLLARGLGASAPDARSLMCGLGMNNNGTGLVLAASALGSLPWAVVPVLAYNLVQHVVAGVVARWVAAPAPSVSDREKGGDGEFLNDHREDLHDADSRSRHL
jgi:BASS family bile acid:Na+ symporter